MEHIDDSISVGRTALFGITKPVDVMRSEPSPVRLRKKDITVVLEVIMCHTERTLTDTRDHCHMTVRVTSNTYCNFNTVYLLRPPL